MLTLHVAIHCRAAAAMPEVLQPWRDLQDARSRCNMSVPTPFCQAAKNVKMLRRHAAAVPEPRRKENIRDRSAPDPHTTPIPDKADTPANIRSVPLNLINHRPRDRRAPAVSLTVFAGLLLDRRHSTVFSKRMVRLSGRSRSEFDRQAFPNRAISAARPSSIA
jgi:hypothetical protein